MGKCSWNQVANTKTRALDDGPTSPGRPGYHWQCDRFGGVQWKVKPLECEGTGGARILRQLPLARVFNLDITPETCSESR